MLQLLTSPVYLILLLVILTSVSIGIAATRRLRTLGTPTS